MNNLAQLFDELDEANKNRLLEYEVLVDASDKLGLVIRTAGTQSEKSINVLIHRIESVYPAKVITREDYQRVGRKIATKLEIVYNLDSYEQKNFLQIYMYGGRWRTNH